MIAVGIGNGAIIYIPLSILLGGAAGYLGFRRFRGPGIDELLDMDLDEEDSGDTEDYSDTKNTEKSNETSTEESDDVGFDELLDMEL